MGVSKKRGTVCPQCGEPAFRVYCVKSGFPRVRYRKCTICGHRDKTAEL